MIWIILACAVASSILYRAGGLSQEEKYWIPKWLRHSWVRDWLCPLFCLLPLFLQHPSWWFIPAYGLTGAAFTTYFDKWFGFDNFWFAGFAVGLAKLPLIFAGFAWWEILVSASALAIAWGAWSALIGNDHLEEHGRGAFAPLSDFLVGIF